MMIKIFKQSLAVIICLIWFNSSVLPQGWEWQNPLPFGDSIQKVFFVDNQHGWMAPLNTTLLRTTDSGQNWEILYTDILFNDIHFIDPLEGWGVGRPGFVPSTRNSVYHTIDGGLTWEIQLADTFVSTDVYFLDHLHGWAAGGDLFHTADGGQTWRKQIDNEIVVGVTFLDTLKGWAVGAFSYGLRTIDGGQTWEQDSSLAGVEQLIYTDSLHLWGESDSRFVWWSTDGGENWTRTSITDTIVEVRSRDIVALDNDRIFMATNIGIYASSDGGQNWYYFSTQAMNSLVFLNDLEVWAGGVELIFPGFLHSTDGGQTWENLIHSNIPHGFDIMAKVDFVDSQTGWIVGTNILKTTDGGQSWIEQHSGGGGNLTFVDDQTGWVIGGNGKILHTADGGENWLPQNSGTNFPLVGISFVDHTHGWVVGRDFTGNGFEGIILHTSDGGQTWIDQTPGLITGLSGVSFVDSLNGWVVGGGGSAIDYGIILHTSDGGQSWVVQRQHSDLELNTVFFIDSLYGWAAGYDPQTQAPIIHTTNGGQTWLGQFGANGDDMIFLDRQNGWMVWLLGWIYHTSDGGQTWVTQPSYTTNHLLGVDFVDSLNGWAVGVGGRILHTTTGGITSIAPAQLRPSLPKKFILHPNFPNPFNPETRIRFEILQPVDRASLTIFDILGRKVKTLLDRELSTGPHVISWDGRNAAGCPVSSGIYLYRLEAGGRAGRNQEDAVVEVMQGCFQIT